MRSTLLAFAVLGGASGATTPLHAQPHDTVWVWNARCHAPSFVAIRVRLDSATLYSSSIPICRWERRFEKGRARFRFAPPRPLVWYGYRSDGVTLRKMSGIQPLRIRPLKSTCGRQAARRT